MRQTNTDIRVRAFVLAIIDHKYVLLDDDCIILQVTEVQDQTIADNIDIKLD